MTHGLPGDRSYVKFLANGTPHWETSRTWQRMVPSDDLHEILEDYVTQRWDDAR